MRIPATLGMVMVAVAAALPAPAGAETRRMTPDMTWTPDMTCATARGIVKRNGAAVLYTGPHLYDRYVDHDGYCPTMMRTKAAWVPTRDNPECFIGFTCEQPNVRSRR